MRGPVRIPKREELDVGLLNDDWIKSMPNSWDIHPKTAARLLEDLGVLDAPLEAQREAMEKFVWLPAAQAMPIWMQEELIEMGILAGLGGWAAEGKGPKRPG